MWWNQKLETLPNTTQTLLLFFPAKFLNNKIRIENVSLLWLLAAHLKILVVRSRLPASSLSCLLGARVNAIWLLVLLICTRRSFPLCSWRIRLRRLIIHLIAGISLCLLGLSIYFFFFLCLSISPPFLYRGDEESNTRWAAWEDARI